MLISPQTIESELARMRECLINDDFTEAAKVSQNLSSTKIVEILIDFEPEAIASCLSFMDKRRAGRVLAHTPPLLAVKVIEILPEAERTNISNNIPVDNLLNILEAMDKDDQKEFTAQLSSNLQNHLAKVSLYSKESAGRIMSPYFVAVKENQTVAETLDIVLSAPPEVERSPYIYVLNNEGKPSGVLSIKDMLRVNPSMIVKDVMNANVITVGISDSSYEAAILIRNRRFMMLPVVDDQGIISGVITFDDAMQVLSREAAGLITTASAITSEESFFTPPMQAVKGRLPWMAANVFLNIGAIAVITGFEETIATVAILAAFIPMITDMGGNVGIQSLSVAIRSIALGEARLRDFKKVIYKEISIGLVNGLCLGLLFSIIALMLRGNIYLGLLAGVALGINVLVAGLVGGLLPFLIKSLGKDPAMMTGPVLTTITDITGVSIYLGLSTIFIAVLTI